MNKSFGYRGNGRQDRCDTFIAFGVKINNSCGSSLSGAAWTVVAILSVVGAVAVIYKKRGEKTEEDK